MTVETGDDTVTMLGRYLYSRRVHGVSMIAVNEQEADKREDSKGVRCDNMAHQDHDKLHHYVFFFNMSVTTRPSAGR